MLEIIQHSATAYNGKIISNLLICLKSQTKQQQYLLLAFYKSHVQEFFNIFFNIYYRTLYGVLLFLSRILDLYFVYFLQERQIKLSILTNQGKTVNFGARALTFKIFQ